MFSALALLTVAGFITRTSSRAESRDLGGLQARHPRPPRSLDYARDDGQAGQRVSALTTGLLSCCSWCAGNIATKTSVHPPMRTRSTSYISGSTDALDIVSGLAQVTVRMFEPAPSAKARRHLVRSSTSKSSWIVKSVGAPSE